MKGVELARPPATPACVVSHETVRQWARKFGQPFAPASEIPNDTPCFYSCLRPAATGVETHCVPVYSRNTSASSRRRVELYRPTHAFTPAVWIALCLIFRASRG
jgi:hypothetical protein